ncbi:HRDC domain-containing protein [Microlunatus sp. Y2014]|uniref:ribonuclease D n=1 Tax=Microlunatus sp. Y2014 TaxID=3418488 RepID=UPI003DA6FF31
MSADKAPSPPSPPDKSGRPDQTDSPETPETPEAPETPVTPVTPEAPLLSAPADGVPELTTTPDALAEVVDALDHGSGPVALDAERAHGFRYSTRAYLIQLRRTGSGTHLVDPIPFRDGDAEADLSALQPALTHEWILHAASQDLPCLTQVGLHPTTLFDTELAGRLLGFPRVALGTLVEEQLGVRLRKEHSASDWSSRPLPNDWLVYAALDVELLVDLRNVLADQLQQAGKDGWAAEEFAALVASAGTPPAARVDPWRRTSGMHGVRTPRQLAVVRELWTVRDQLASSMDKAPGKVLPDKAISEAAATLQEATRAGLRRIEGFQRRQAKRYEENWLAAIDRALSLSRKELPVLRLPADGPPPPRTWAKREPEAAQRLHRVREFVTQQSEELAVPAENLLTPDTLRRLAWQPPGEVDAATVSGFLADRGARSWQRELLTPGLVSALLDS